MLRQRINMNGNSNPNLSKQVHDKIVAELISGELQLGAKLTECQIANEMGISRGPVREAFNRLAEGGLLTLIPRTGCVINTVSEQDVLELYEIRKRLECLALDLGFDKFDMNKIVVLRKEFLAYSGLNFGGSVESYIDSDFRFHNMIIETANNANISDIIKRIHVKVEIFSRRGKVYYARLRDALKEHIDILNAIIDGKKEEAVRYLEVHLENSKQQVLKHEVKHPTQSNNEIENNNISEIAPRKESLRKNNSKQIMLK
jgi:DNA-binding GntR family transcriptional regulator